MSDDLNLDFGLDFEIPSIILHPTTVATLADVRVGCGNILKRDFTRADGAQVHDWSIRLMPADDETNRGLIVGLGSEFVVNGNRFVVTALQAADEESLGTVTISPVF